MVVSVWGQRLTIGVYSLVYLINLVYCVHESIHLLLLDHHPGSGSSNSYNSSSAANAAKKRVKDFSSGSGQRGIFYLLLMSANLGRFSWLVWDSIAIAPIRDKDLETHPEEALGEVNGSETNFDITHFLRLLPELGFIIAYTFLSAYFGQFKNATSGSPSSWLYYTVTVRGVSMVLVFGCLIIATYNGWCPTTVYAYMALLYVITIGTLVTSCLWVIKQLPNMTTTKDRIAKKLLPAILLVLFSLFGGALLNGISCLQHWRFGFPESHAYLFGFFYFLVFEGLPCSALLYVLRRPNTSSSTTSGTSSISSSASSSAAGYSYSTRSSASGYGFGTGDPSSSSSTSTSMYPPNRNSSNSNTSSNSSSSSKTGGGYGSLLVVVGGGVSSSSSGNDGTTSNTSNAAASATMPSGPGGSSTNSIETDPLL